MRQPYAMKTLIEQVSQKREDATATADEADGLGVYRQVTFDEETSNWLEPIIGVIAQKDRRINSYFTSRGGMLIINFVSDYRADSREPFALTAVERVLASDPDTQAEAVEARRKELNAIPVADLREEHGYTKEFSKAAIIDVLIAEEFSGPDED